MKILTLNNLPFSLENLPESVDENMQFSVLNNSNTSDPDFFFTPLIFLESFNSPAIVLKIDGNEIVMPLDWSIVVGDATTGADAEVLPLTSLNDRGFDALYINPITAFRVDFAPIEIINFYNDVKWYFPKLRAGELLAVPVEQKHNPKCAFFVKEVSKSGSLIQIAELL